MQYTVSFLESQFQHLIEHLFAGGRNEQAAFLRAREVTTKHRVNLLVREIIPVNASDIFSSSGTHMSIRSRAYLRAIKKADLEGDSFIFVHSHPLGSPQFSPQDDSEEVALFRTAHTRIHREAVHASLIFTNEKMFCGRVWLADGSHRSVNRVRAIGNRFRFLSSEVSAETPVEYFDRQARAFTSELQPLLKGLNIGVVGVGGTGSAVCEQLVRLGVGKLTVIDGGRFEKSNVSRVYGSTVFDEDVPKANIAAGLAATIGLRTDVQAIHGHLSYQSVTRRLIDCDAVFGCTDDEWGRSILNRLALRYFIPVFDMGVNIDTANGKITGVQGRVTTLMPGTACLFCRKRISSDRVRAESVAACNPEEAARLRKEGYLTNIDEPAPAVISFTSGIAALAITELLHRITGFQGAERNSTEVIYFFDQNRIRTNSTPPAANCLCADATKFGTGDTKRFLDLNWRET